MHTHDTKASRDASRFGKRHGMAVHVRAEHRYQAYVREGIGIAQRMKLGRICIDVVFLWVQVDIVRAHTVPRRPTFVRNLCV